MVKETGGIPVMDPQTHPAPKGRAKCPPALTKNDLTCDFHDEEKDKKFQSLLNNIRVASRQRNRRRRDRPNTAPVKTDESGKLTTPHRRPKARNADHRMKMRVQLRPRTPGNIIYSITDDGGDLQQHVISKQSASN